MPRDLTREVKETRARLSAAMAGTLPDRQFSATIILATISLHWKAKDVARTHDLKKRRQCHKEFDQTKAAINKGIRLLYSQGPALPKQPNNQQPEITSLPMVGGSIV